MHAFIYMHYIFLKYDWIQKNRKENLKYNMQSMQRIL